MITSLSDNDIQWLKDLWDRNEKVPYTTGGKNIVVGELITTIFNPELKEFVKDRFEIAGPVGGQFAKLDRPLGIHVDVLYDLKIRHFTRDGPARTHYVVVDTDATAPMYTILLKETVDYTVWSGFKDIVGGTYPDGNSAIIDYDESRPTVREQFFDHQIDHYPPRFRDLHLSFERTIPLTIGEVVSWNSAQFHSGCSFSESKSTYKLHLTVISPDG